MTKKLKFFLGLPIGKGMAGKNRKKKRCKMLENTLRNCCKLLKLLRIFTPPPPPPPALRHKWLRSLFCAPLISRKAGIGIAEVLVASVLGSVLLLGSAQSLKFSLQSAQVSRSILTENDLKASISQGLKGGCATHLRPSQLTNTDTAKKNKGIGTVTNGLPGVKVGDFNGDIEVVKIELTGDPADEDRLLVVYYKKKGLGEDLNTLGGAACSPKDGTTPAVTTGCYYHRCSIDYSGIFDDYSTSPPTPVSPPENQKCKLKTCHNIAQEVLAQVDQRVVTKVSEAITNKACSGDDYLKGFDEDGNPDCATAIKIKNCGENKVVQGIDDEGNLICADGCTGGRSLITIDERRFCICPDGEQWRFVFEAQKEICSPCIWYGQKYVHTESPPSCMRCTNGTWDMSAGHAQCVCPPQKKKSNPINGIFIVGTALLVNPFPEGIVAPTIRNLSQS